MKQIKTVGEACFITTGKLDANQAQIDGKYPFFTCAENPERINEYSYDDDVVLVAGNNANGNFHTTRYSGKFNAYQRTYILTAKPSTNIDFAYYSIKLGLAYLKTSSQGSQTKFLTKSLLSNLPLRNMLEHEQIRVTTILRLIENKIELNNRINAKLEAMAKTLYDYWFVQFDFPDANGKPYKTTGGKMVYNPTLKREIPGGWEAGTLDNLGEISGGSTPSRKVSENFAEHGAPWLTPNDLSGRQHYKFISRGKYDVSDTGIKNASLKKYPKGTVVLTSRAPIGYMAIARNEVTTNQGFKSFIPNSQYSSEFIFYTVKSLMELIIKYGTGSTFKEISKTVLKTIKTPLPPISLINDFTNKVYPIFKRQDLLEQENQQLSQLRDWLLPMLMNGQVKVS